MGPPAAGADSGRVRVRSLEIRLQPVQRFLVESARADDICLWPSKNRTGLENGLVVGEHNGIGNVGIRQRHASASVSEDFHDCEGLSALSGELCAERVSEPVCM